MVLRDHFTQYSIAVFARRIKTDWDSKKNKPAKGGGNSYELFKNDILNWIKSDKNRPNTFYTSLVDLYAFPRDKDSPYNEVIQSITDCYKRVTALEEAIYKEINDKRFIPYIQLHEFEALLFTDIEQLAHMYPNCETQITRLKSDTVFLHPEEINESKETAPSKRIISYFPKYAKKKAQAGPIIAKEIGLENLRSKCPHFNAWIDK